MHPKESMVLFPTVGAGHLSPTVELAKLFVNDGFSVMVVVVVMDDEFANPDTTNRFISDVSAAYPDISFHHLPKVTPSSKHPILARFETLRLSTRTHLLNFLKATKTTTDIRALVLDMFCTDALDVADELGIPPYVFFASGAAALAGFLRIPYLQSQLPGSFRDLGDTPIQLPGLPPITFFHLVNFIVDRGELNEVVLFHFDRLWRAQGIMVNTFEWLEKRAVRALAEEAIVPGRRTPPVYCIGPLIADGDKDKDDARHECLEWLDAQPERSVAFLCFGSRGSFEREQLGEIAAGLERSGVRFLWAVRSPLQRLPEGFLERTRGRGMVATSWVPQTEVLSHGSVGVFVSHGGWNSTLEAVSAGVPMIVWPLYAEQGMNKVLLVEEAQLAVGVEGVFEGTVSAEEVERKIRWVMDSADAGALKKRVADAKEEAAAAKKAAGSSTLAWLKLVRSLKKKKQEILH